MTTGLDTGRTGRNVLIRVSGECMWRARSLAEESGDWFGADLVGEQNVARHVS